MEELINKYLNQELPKELETNLENNYLFMLTLIKTTNNYKYYFKISDSLKLNYNFLKEIIYLFQTNKIFIFYISDVYLKNTNDFTNYLELLIILTNIIKEPSTLEEEEYFQELDNLITDIFINLNNYLRDEFDNSLGFIYLFDKFNTKRIILNYLVLKLIDKIFYNNCEYEFSNILTKYQESKLKINDFLIKFISKYDYDLAFYISCNLDLLTALKADFKVMPDEKILKFEKNDKV